MMDIDKSLRLQLQESNSNYLLGVLATDPSEFPYVGEDPNEPVTVMKNSFKLCYFIRPISSQPEPIIELDHYTRETGFSTHYIGFEDAFPRALKLGGFTYTTDMESQIKKVKGLLEGKIIVFRPKISFTSDGKVFKNLDIISLEDGNIALDTEYMPVPIVSDRKKFEQSLQESKLILFHDFHHNMFQPDYVLCEEYLYVFKEGWKKDPGKKNGWLQTMPKDVLKIKVEPSELRARQVIASPNNLVFIDGDYLIELHERAMAEGEDLYSSQGEFSSERAIEDELSLISERQMHDADIVPIAAAAEGTKVRLDSQPLPVTDAQKLEQRFLNDLQKNAIAKRLCYDREDLVNFHISIKTNPLTILSGMSGTGKSQLALLYAKTLGLSKQAGTFLVLPISPSFTEPEDLIGFHNSSTGLYVPSETGLVDFLIHAKNNPSQMHMVIFDEMNLSQVEYWFAPFISLLELDENESYRELKLWSQDAVCHNSAKYPSAITIGDNVIFIGTANMDETTKDFSDRLLDRANIVTPRKMKFTAHKRSITDAGEPDFSNNEFIALYQNRRTYRSWNFNKDAWSAFNDAEMQFFDELHDMIQKYDKQKGVSFRALERIGLYLNNIPVDEHGNPAIRRQDAMDLQVKQRILTKIRGSAEHFGDLIGSLAAREGTPFNSELFEQFNSELAESISHFTLTNEEIKRKARELHINDYAS
jgi:GTPase subunit of restriction endonuclease